MRSRRIKQDGRRILYGDFSGFGGDVDALRAKIEAADRLIHSEPRGSVLSIVDLSGTVTSSEVVGLFKHSAALTRPFREDEPREVRVEHPLGNAARTPPTRRDGSSCGACDLPRRALVRVP